MSDNFLPFRGHESVFSAGSRTFHKDAGAMVTAHYEVRFVWDNTYATHPIDPHTSHIVQDDERHLGSDQGPTAGLDIKHTRPYFMAQETVWRGRFFMAFRPDENLKFKRWYVRNADPRRRRARIRIDIRSCPINFVERVDNGLRVSTARRSNFEEELLYFPGDDIQVGADMFGNFYEVEDPKPVVHVEEEEGGGDEVADVDKAPSTYEWLRE
ncbi:hypothetical protein LTS15_000199 [Exophiala xenobiotica]|nr:hypothetical protein LTS15_000199 [Exophiala xenobiotica]